MITVSSMQGNSYTLTWDFGNNGDTFIISVNGQAIASSVIKQAKITIDPAVSNQIIVSDTTTGQSENLYFMPTSVTTASGMNAFVVAGALTLAGVIIYFVQNRKRKKHHG